jgi:hypothetical protein
MRPGHVERIGLQRPDQPGIAIAPVETGFAGAIQGAPVLIAAEDNLQLGAYGLQGGHLFG